ncbi:MAG: AAA family ATPase [Candidatus Komeilibacteria bacterium]|nr:AAA family ATPase [Candidatus Komeilibacteria bacterium]
MDNWGIIGHQSAISFLDKGLSQNKLAHAYLFYGPPNLGKTAVAEALALKVLGSNELLLTNLLKLETLPDKKDIGIEQVREFCRSLFLKSFSDHYKIGIIYEAEKLNQESANALLKTLEEPAPKTLLIIVSSAWQNLLSTVISRCQAVKFLPVASAELYQGIQDKAEDANTARQIVDWCGGRPGLALKLAQDQEFYQEFAASRDLLTQVLNQDLPGRFKIAENLLEKIDEARQKVLAAEDLLAHLEIYLRQKLKQNVGQIDYAQAGRPSWPIPKILSLFDLIKQTREQLYFNVSPRLLLENVFINL